MTTYAKDVSVRFAPGLDITPIRDGNAVVGLQIRSLADSPDEATAAIAKLALNALTTVAPEVSDRIWDEVVGSVEGSEAVDLEGLEFARLQKLRGRPVPVSTGGGSPTPTARDDGR